MDMTREQAIKVLEMFLHKQCSLSRTEFAYSQNEIWDAVKMASDALKKQIAKEPKEKIYGNVKYQLCPECGRVLFGKEYYCANCGQRVNRGE